MTGATDRRGWIALGLILGLALLLRLAWVVWINPNPGLEGGDAVFYLRLARLIAYTRTYPVLWTNAVGPAYIFFLSIFYFLLPEAAVVQAIRITQAVLDSLTCLLAFDIGRRLFNRGVGLAAAAALAIDLRFIVQTGEIYTETFFTLLLALGVWAFIRLREQGLNRVSWYLAASLPLLLAALTRVIALPLPFLLFGSLMLPRPTRLQRIVTAACLAATLILVAGYGAYVYQQTGTFVLVSEGLNSNFWMGSRGNGDWPGNAQFQDDLDALIKQYGRAAYLEDAFKTIAADPPAYLQLLASKLIRSYAQPHGTVAFGGGSLKDLLAKVLSGQASPGDLMSREAFVPKLHIYILHFSGLALGLAGIWLTRRQWLSVLPLTLPIVFFTFAYTLLTIIPRYLFPIMPFFTVLAAYTGVSVWGALKLGRAAAVPARA